MMRFTSWSVRLSKTTSLTFVAFVVFSGMAVADDAVRQNVRPTYWLDVGMFFPERTLSFEAGLDSDGARGVDFHKALGLEEHDEVVAANFRWRFGDKWSVSGQYFQVSAQATALLNEDLEWNDMVFGSGSSVRASSDLVLMRVMFGRSFTVSEHTDFGIGAGVHWLAIGAAISGDILVDDGVQFSREGVSAEAPLPNVGAWYNRALSDRWAIRARADWISASVDEYSGRLLNFKAGFDYRVGRNFGVGIAYNFVELDLSVENNNWTGKAGIEYRGVFAYLSALW